MSRATTALLWSVFFCSVTNAAELRSIHVDHDRGRYTVESEVWFDAPLERVFDVFRNWDLSTQFSSAITEARNVEADDVGRPQYFVRNEGCLLFFCRSFVRQGYVELEVNEELRAFANPAISDFRLSEETWRFSVENGGTVVSYHLLMEPGFWVPPLIGPYVIKRKFRNSGSDAIDRIEAIAQDLTRQPEWNVD